MIKFKKWVMAAALLTVLTGCATSQSNVTPRGDDPICSETWEPISFKDEYSLGDSLTLPASYVEIDGVRHPASATLEKPDGTVSTASTHILNTVGNYTIKYFATVDGKTYLNTHPFKVVAGFYTLDNKSGLSSVTYGLHEKATYKNTEGLMVRLGEGDTLTFNQLINVNDLTIDDRLFEAFITPDTVGKYDFSKLVVTLTDSADEENYCKMYIHRYELGEKYDLSCKSWFYAGATGVGTAGCGTWGDKEDAGGYVQKNNGHGAIMPMTFTGMDNKEGTEETKEVPFDYSIIRLSYDSPTMRCIDRYTYYNPVTQKVGEVLVWFCKFDSPRFFPKQWHGFTSDKVKLSVTAEDYTSKTANFCISKILDWNLKQTSFIDNDPPEITINTSYDIDNMPLACKDYHYEVPAATGYDEYSGACEVETKVFYNYPDNPISVKVVDNKFVTDKPGIYAIVYNSHDQSGNEASKVLWVRCQSQLDPIKINLNDQTRSGFLGELIKPSEYTVENTSGNYTMDISAVNEDYGEEYEDVKEGFRPQSQGGWKIIYHVTDMIGREAIVEQPLTTTISPDPIIQEVIIPAKTYVSGGIYTMPYAEAYKYTGDEEIEAIDCTVKVDCYDLDLDTAVYTEKHEEIYSGDEIQIYTNEHLGITKFQYFALDGEENKSVTDVFEVPTVLPFEYDPQEEYFAFDATKYFYNANDNLAFEPDSDSEATGIYMKSTGATNFADATFANPVYANAFQLETQSVVGKVYGKIALSLIDSLNGEYVTVYVVIDGTGSHIEYLGETYPCYFSISSVSNLTFAYSNGVLAIDDTLIPLTEYASGKTFNGFPSGKVYPEIDLINAEKDAQLKILKINGAVLSSTTVDRSTPTIDLIGDYGGFYNKDTTYETNVAFAGDAFAPNTDLTLTITDPDGVKQTYTDCSVSNSYVFKKYGAYNFKYQAKTSNGYTTKPSKTVSFNVNIVSTQGPTISLDGDLPTKVSKGQAINLPTYKVSDDRTKEEDIIVRVYAIDAQGYFQLLSNDKKTYKPTCVGTLELRWVAYDEDGNITLLQKYITVE